MDTSKTSKIAEEMRERLSRARRGLAREGAAPARPKEADKARHDQNEAAAKISYGDHARLDEVGDVSPVAGLFGLFRDAINDAKAAVGQALHDPKSGRPVWGVQEARGRRVTSMEARDLPEVSEFDLSGWGGPFGRAGRVAGATTIPHLTQVGEQGTPAGANTGPATPPKPAQAAPGPVSFFDRLGAAQDALDAQGAAARRKTAGFEKFANSQPVQQGANALGLGDALNLAQQGVRAAAGDPTAMASLAITAAQKVGQKVKDVVTDPFKGGMQAFQGETVGEVGKGFATATKHVPIVGGVTKVVSLVAESIDKLRAWNDKLHEGNMRFAEFSAAMSRVEAQQEVRDIKESQRRGDRRAKSAEYLAEQKSRLSQSISPAEDAWANLKNWGTGYFNKIIADFLEPLAQAARIWMGEGREETAEGMVDAAVRINEADWASTYGRPWFMHRDGTEDQTLIPNNQLPRR